MEEEKKESITCEQCEYCYIKSSIYGICLEKKRNVKRDKEICKSYKRKSCMASVKLIDDIANHFCENDSSLVLLADGNPIVRITKDLTINEVEVLLRVYCLAEHTYSIVEE